MNSNNEANQKLLKLVEHYNSVIAKIFEGCELQATQLEVNRNGIKYIRSSNYKLAIRGLRKQVMDQLKEVSNATKL